MRIHKRNFVKDVGLVKNISERLEKKISKENIPQDQIDKLSLEELQDLNKIVGLANFMLCKYEDKKNTKEIMENFVSIIESTCLSMDGIDDEIAELLVAAEDTIGKVKCMHANISDKSDLTHVPRPGQEGVKTGSNNLTNTATEINTLEYLHKPRCDDAQVI